MNILYLIITLFALGALVGMYLLALVLQKKETSKSVSFVHGVLVVTALVLLIFYACNHRPGPAESIVAFLIAAVGGLTLIIRDITKRSLPKWLAVGHGIIAAVGFIFLLVFAFVEH